MDNYASLVIGIVSGVLASIIFQALGVFFIKVIVPWYQSKVFEGIDIQGRWEGKQVRANGTYTFALDIVQVGHTITGNYSTVDTYPNETKSRQFILKGSIVNNTVVLTYESANKRRYGAGTFLLAIHDGGNELKGTVTFLKTTIGAIGTDADLTLRRAS